MLSELIRQNQNSSTVSTQVASKPKYKTQVERKSELDETQKRLAHLSKHDTDDNRREFAKLQDVYSKLKCELCGGIAHSFFKCALYNGYKNDIKEKLPHLLPYWRYLVTRALYNTRYLSYASEFE